MPFELGAKKAGLSLVRAFLQSIEGVRPALPEAVVRRSEINYKFKTYKNGKLVDFRIIQTLEDAFPCRGDKK